VCGRVCPRSCRWRCGLAEIYLGSAAIGSQWVQPLRHGDPIDVCTAIAGASFALISLIFIARARGCLSDWRSSQ
jgi:hypothetical protein